MPTPLPFRNLVAQARLGISREEHEAYFRGLLADVDEPTAPFGLLNVQGDGTGNAQAHMRVEAGLARRIRESARKLGSERGEFVSRGVGAGGSADIGTRGRGVRDHAVRADAGRGRH